MGLIKQSRHKLPVRLPVPGAVWGDYPQADEPADGRSPLRKSTIQDFDAELIARLATERDRAMVGPNKVRSSLSCRGLCNETVADALACIAAQIEQHTGLKARFGQFLSAAAMIDQRLAEMATGEGKTMAAALAAGTAALSGSPVHVLTANDYLAKRDATQFSPVYNALGLSCASALDSMTEDERRRQYAADICYATARTVAFDYLRDMQASQAPLVTHKTRESTRLRGLCFAILDEADNILLDEGTMPLVLAQSFDDPKQRARAWQAINIARQLNRDSDFILDHDSRRIRLSQSGKSNVATISAPYGDNWRIERYRNDLICQALQALYLLQADTDYLLIDKQIVLIDKISGRLAPQRQLPGELHALVAIKENLVPPPASRATTGLTFPRFFSRYHHLCGLSGTLTESRQELKSVYGLRMVSIARHKPNALKRYRSRQFADRDSHFKAAVVRAHQMARRGRPVLIGTDSVTDSKHLQKFFELANREVTLLNAASDADEATIIARSGRSGQITISTQLAGRGTDIEPDEQALKCGGLHVLNLQHNRCPRSDRQLCGRAARQGNPGSAEHWIRTNQSALQPERLPKVVSPIISKLSSLNQPMLLLRLAQFSWRLDDRLQRVNRLRADRDWSQKLHFSSMSTQ